MKFEVGQGRELAGRVGSEIRRLGGKETNRMGRG